MPQFSRQSSRPLTPTGYLASVRRILELLDVIHAYALIPPTTPRDRARLTRAIHGLSLAAQSLSRRHRRLPHIEDLRRTDGDVDAYTG